MTMQSERREIHIGRLIVARVIRGWVWLIVFFALILPLIGVGVNLVAPAFDASKRPFTEQEMRDAANGNCYWSKSQRMTC